MFYKLKGGKQECTRCLGSGCYTCRNTGYIVCCPMCMDIDPRVDHDHYHCPQCGAKYSSSGEVLDMNDPE